ncbi:neocarzinostatin apoprotein domain-containing protein [Streptomyces sp. MB09-02B]|uniref:neocarzinostatin apoprotein domain-containing protein n=1 Tax=Streptomyces sp. MB09-02B TaxID=3028667 RepID=UPI0029A43C81|nr:neocarzinostatin apoprotein domain-containing protein [Streptomyces sp. MB09-02B]MDX3640304.1 neocarzinostatin apoprotein domain-containing protein [Streptomyces sp. MB09-02B]
MAAGGSANGPEGQKLTVSKSSGLDPDGETVTVSGTGYNTEKGIYVAFCVDNGAGKTPTPCIGGVDMSGDSGASVWVSSNPPSYGEGLAKPYKGSGHKGTFSVSLKVRAKDANTDCAKSGVTCSVITRNDHTRGGDQSQTARIPVTFTGAGGNGDDPGAGGTATPSASASTTTTGGIGSTGSTGGTSSGTGTSNDPLADTGSAAVPLGITATGLVAAGGAAWFWARRRRTANAS